MGDYADMEIDRMIDSERWGWDRPRRRPVRITCPTCRKTNLRYGDVKGGGMQLVDPHTSIPHKCLIPGQLPKPSIL